MDYLFPKVMKEFIHPFDVNADKLFTKKPTLKRLKEIIFNGYSIDRGIGMDHVKELQNKVSNIWIKNIGELFKYGIVPYAMFSWRDAKTHTDSIIPWRANANNILLKTAIILINEDVVDKKLLNYELWYSYNFDIPKVYNKLGIDLEKTLLKTDDDISSNKRSTD